MSDHLDLSSHTRPNELRPPREPVPAGVGGNSPIQRLVAASLGQPLLIALLALAVIVGGIFSLRRLPVDAYPDVSPPRVGITTQWPGHAAEEIEHKGVAHDTWLHATRDWPRFKRWKLKTRVMLYVTRNFLVDRTQGALDLMRQDEVTGLSAWAKLLNYLWLRPGMFRKIAGAWASFFMPGFHPWNEDDRALLRAYAASAPPADEPKRKVRRAV